MTKNNKVKKAKSVQEADKKIIDKAKVEQEKDNFFHSFYAFLSQYSVVGLAIGLVIGSSTQNVVKQLVDGLITPLISLVMNIFLPALGPIREWSIVINEITFFPGNILQSLIEFIIILFIIYFVVKIILRREDLLDKKK